MSGDGGFVGWDPPFGHYALPQEGSIYLGGHFYRDVPEEPLQMSASDGVLLLQALAGNHIAQRHFRGSAAPLKGDKRDFSIAFLADRESDFIAFETAQADSELLYFCPGLYVADSFDATSGQTYNLTRPLAQGIVAGLSAPARFFVAGTEDPTAGTATGQSFLAATTNRITVWYMAAFRVVVTSYGYTIDGVNDLRVSATLSEGVVWSFG